MRAPVIGQVWVCRAQAHRGHVVQVLALTPQKVELRRLQRAGKHGGKSMFWLPLQHFCTAYAPRGEGR